MPARRWLARRGASAGGALAILALLLVTAVAFAPASTATDRSSVVASPAPSRTAASDPAASVFQVSFAEYSLPLGATWYVNISGQPSLSATVTIATGTTLSTNLTNGSYAYVVGTNVQYFVAPGGTFNVTGAAEGFNVLFGLQPGIFEVLFLESGIAGGTNWSVTWNGTTNAQFAPNTIAFYATNGTYHYAIGSVPTYTSNVTEGNLTIRGMGQVIQIRFSGPPGPTPSSGTSFPWTWLLAGIIGAGVVLLVVWVSVKSRAEPQTPDDDTIDRDRTRPPEGST